jgi:murein L,D-transpeptidase YafK
MSGTKILSLFLTFISFNFALTAQDSFYDQQREHAKINGIAVRLEDSIAKQLKAKLGVDTISSMFCRAFKWDGQFEVWVRKSNLDSFVLYKSYKICNSSGVMGPKRFEGDYQVPEGFYSINKFNPNSSFHVSLGLNYPNASDRVLSDSIHPGNDIFIHGGCASVGCIPIKNEPMEEVYILATMAKTAGQDFIPVHIFPVKFNKQVSNNYLNTLLAKDAAYKKFIENIKPGYEYFEKKRRLPVIMINAKGEYKYQ